MANIQTAAAYIRVSTDDQVEFSPDAQLKAIKKYCKDNGILLDNAHIYIDQGISGRKADKRPAFQEMIKHAKKKEFNVILVHKFDRFARSREDSVVYKSLLKRECNIKVISITESIEDDKFSVILEAMLEAMAEYYSLNLSDEVKKGMTEKEVAFEIERYMILHGADGLAFDTIVASGPNSSMPHAVPTDRKIEDGDPITIDMGCKYNGYCSDMTRTVFAGHVPQYMKPVYDLVLKNQLRVAEDIKDGANLKLISKSVESEFKINGANMIHSLGHGVGLDIHEYPFMSTKYDFLLKENMVVTNEPGIYIAGRFGVRIEDTVLITKYASQNLTLSEKGYVIVG